MWFTESLLSAFLQMRFGEGKMALVRTIHLRGHYGYYGITGNGAAVGRFFHEVTNAWRKWLGRRSQRAHLTWARLLALLARYPLPPPRVVHSIYTRTANP